MTATEIYAQVILHPGCAIPPKGEQESRLHKWHECRSQYFYRRTARKHQHKLKSNGLRIKGFKQDTLAAHLGHRLTVYYEGDSKAVLVCKDEGKTIDGSVLQ